MKSRCICCRNVHHMRHGRLSPTKPGPTSAWGAGAGVAGTSFSVFTCVAETPNIVHTVYLLSVSILLCAIMQVHNTLYIYIHNIHTHVLCIERGRCRCLGFIRSVVQPCWTHESLSSWGHGWPVYMSAGLKWTESWSFTELSVLSLHHCTWQKIAPKGSHATGSHGILLPVCFVTCHLPFASRVWVASPWLGTNTPSLAVKATPPGLA